MHLYRTHTCGALRNTDVGQVVRLSGWVHRKRDHGNLLFVDLRDHYGITQCVVEQGEKTFGGADAVRAESVVSILGRVVVRSPETVNANLPTGSIEVRINAFDVLSAAEELPLQVFGDHDYPEDLRLRYRYLDLRREKLHANILLRSHVINSIRRRMVDQGFTEFQTPILTASSPEGARDYLVPSRLHPGKFYALPQAPQQFKQLYMVAGFDRYFQIAPCFRDEDARADRSPGEFYQLDVEMSFVEQDDVFKAIEPVMHGVFAEFAEGKAVTPTPFPRISYRDSMLKYGNDKPDMRNPIVIADVTEAFKGSSFGIFARAIGNGAVVRAIPAPGAAKQPRSFFDKLNDWAKEEGWPGLGYIVFEGGAPEARSSSDSADLGAKGPIAKNVDAARQKQIFDAAGLKPGDAVFFACDKPQKATQLAGLARTRICNELGLLEKNTFKFCWIVDFPMYEFNETDQKIDFSHNPFSMPQGGMEALMTQDPLQILAYQYDIVCNGVELSSGAIRNHLPDVMVRAFEIAGYARKDVEERFGGMFSAFHYGAPPHGGTAPGIDRIVMLLAEEPNLREVVAFPMTQRAEDLLMGAPAEVSEKQLREVHIRVQLPPDLAKKKAAT
ncbi:MAG: aspartate--tRNA ligase [Alphaproteobacteria bacterium]|nr:aspartate--tRNA ligase [Alphaproteobacteria bacterium]